MRIKFIAVKKTKYSKSLIRMVDIIRNARLPQRSTIRIVPQINEHDRNELGDKVSVISKFNKVSMTINRIIAMRIRNSSKRWLSANNGIEEGVRPWLL